MKLVYIPCLIRLNNMLFIIGNIQSEYGGIEVLNLVSNLKNLYELFSNSDFSINLEISLIEYSSSSTFFKLKSLQLILKDDGSI